MRFGHFFVDRPIFASVISIIIVVVGVVSLYGLPIAQFPQIAPPTIRVSAAYPGANAETIAETVATPLEQQINGVEGMIYQTSQAANDGSLSITVTFATGTNLDTAQVQVQNRVATAEPRLPAEVRALGITVNKAASDFLMVVNLSSPDGTLNEYDISNYTLVNIRDQLTRAYGVGDTFLFGVREPSLRVWLDPDRLAAFGLTAGDVTAALQEQNVQVSGGTLGSPPAPNGVAFELNVTTQGRFRTADEFKDVIVKSTSDGRLLRVRDVARVEVGARSYSTNSYLDGRFAVGIAVQQRPGTNALAAAQAARATMEQLKASFPKGLQYDIVYNPTEFVSASIASVEETFIEAIVLVVLVVIVFLQSFRAALIPIASIPVSLVGTFAVMSALGFSINLLTLFGLILAIGVVVDDAIIVVENVERNMRDGMSPREAAHRTMDEVGTAVIAIALVLCAVFVPTALIPGISGKFYQQFAVTIAAATVISAFNSLSLSPALAALLLKAHPAGHGRKSLAQRFSEIFNGGFDRLSNGYGHAVGFVARRRIVFLLVYLLLIGGTVWIVNRVPTGFVPASDQGYAIVAIQLPDGASLQRTDAAVKKAVEIIRQSPGVAHTIGIAGFSGASFTAASNAAAIFVPFQPFDERLKAGLSANAVVGEIQKRLGAIQDGFIIAIQPPTIQGLGQGGFKMMIEDRGNLGFAELEKRANAFIAKANATPGLVGVFTTFSTRSPQIYLDVDRVRARMLGVPVSAIFEALQVYIGSSYVNDFTFQGRAFQVNAQADSSFRLNEADIARIKVRSSAGALVPLGSLVAFRNSAGPASVTRYNIYPAITVQGSGAPGVSSNQALLLMEQAANQTLGQGATFEWTDVAYQQRNVGNTANLVFGLAVLFVFLFLSAQYESWGLPLAIILIVPLSIAAALGGVLLRGTDNNIMTQISFVVLIGLAAKNAILIVEFARQREEHGDTPVKAVVEACRLRLRPILMTSFAFILGVLPLAIATGPGAELRQAIGTAVVFGMSGVTLLGLFLTPVFYVVIRSIVLRVSRKPQRPATTPEGLTEIPGA